MTAPRRLARTTLLALTCALAIPCAIARPAEAHAQDSATLGRARGALVQYDIEGDRTLDVLRELGTLVPEGGAVGREARALRALVATDLLVISRFDPRHQGLEARLAAVFDVDAAGLVPRLEVELVAVRSRMYRDVVDDARNALALVDEVDVSVPVDWTRHRGVRRDLLFLRATARGLVDAGAAFDPCASANDACPEPWSSWDAPTRARVGALLEAGEAAARLAQAATDGDPLVRTLAEVVHEQQATIERTRVDPGLWLGSRQDLLVADAGERPLHVDRLLVVGSDRLDALGTPDVAVRGGELVVPDAESAEPIALLRAAFPFASTTSLDEPIRMGLGPIVRGAALAIAPTADLSCDALWSVLAAARSVGVGAISLVRRRHDGALVGDELLLADEPRGELEAGTVVLRIRPGYLVLDRGEESSVIERQRGDDAFAGDLSEIRRALGRRATRRVLVTFAGSTRVTDVLRFALALRREGRVPVSLAVRGL